MIEAIVAAIGVLTLLIVVARTVRIVPQARAGVVERLGRYSRTLTPGLVILVPVVDRVRQMIDLREQVVSFEPQPVITEDNLVLSIDTVIYYQVTDARSATYEIANYIQAIEQLTVTTLRNLIGGMSLEQTLTSRDGINDELRVVLDEATGKWGIRVNRVELKAIDPPRTIQEAMEKQMRADRDKRAAILTAEGVKQSQILTAEGERQSTILRAQGERESQMLRAEGQAKAIETVFKAIHDNDPDPKLLAYQYLQMLPQIAAGEGSTMWMIPSELTQAMGAMASGFKAPAPEPASMSPPRTVRSALSRARLLSADALGPLAQQVSHDHLDGARDRDRDQRAEDAQQRGAGEHGDQHHQGRHLHRAAVDGRLDQVILDLLVDHDHDEHDDPVGGATREVRNGDHQDRRDGGAHQRHQVADRHHHPQRQRVGDVEDP